MGKKTRFSLIVFTRLPRAGQTKTRLIPALGDDGAAQLQGEMTEWCLGWARCLREDDEVDVEVRYTGGSEEEMAEVFGEDLVYVDQGEGDLGERMARVFEERFRDGYERVVIVGSDCPCANDKVMREGFGILEEKEGVVGPADDGGYYLIGLREMEKGRYGRLFEGMVWGEDGVMEETRVRARDVGIELAELEVLRDVDVEGDLAVWEEVKGGKRPRSLKGRVGVIVPTLNEGERVEKVLRRILSGVDGDVVVADGGSMDGTVEQMERMGVKVVRSEKGRGKQMNAGAHEVDGDYLVFCHADTLLPFGWDRMVRMTLSDKGVGLGAFRLKIDEEGEAYRRVERGVARRCKWKGMPYGDQGLFVRREDFESVGGFVEQAIMEDYELVKAMRKRGKVRVLECAARTSGRAWKAVGVGRMTMINQIVLWGYRLGVGAERLARWRERRIRGVIGER